LSETGQFAFFCLKAAFKRESVQRAVYARPSMCLMGHSTLLTYFYSWLQCIN